MSARWAPGGRCCRSVWRCCCCCCCRPPLPTCRGPALRSRAGRGSASLSRSPPLPPPRRSSSHRSPKRNMGLPVSPWPGPRQRNRPAPETRRRAGSIITAADTGWSSGSGATFRLRTSLPSGYWWPAWPKSVSPLCVWVCVCVCIVYDLWFSNSLMNQVLRSVKERSNAWQTSARYWFMILVPPTLEV